MRIVSATEASVRESSRRMFEKAHQLRPAWSRQVLWRLHVVNGKKCVHGMRSNSSDPLSGRGHFEAFLAEPRGMRLGNDAAIGRRDGFFQRMRYHVLGDLRLHYNDFSGLSGHWNPLLTAVNSLLADQSPHLAGN